MGRETYGVPITSLHEIVRVPEITAVPDAPDYMEGVINLRGKIVSVIDLRKRFGETKTSAQPPQPHSGGGTRRAGFRADRRFGFGSPEDSRDRDRAFSATLQDGGLNCVTGLGKYKGRLIVLLDMAKLLESAGRKPEQNRA